MSIKGLAGSHIWPTSCFVLPAMNSNKTERHGNYGALWPSRSESSQATTDTTSSATSPS